MTTNDAPKDSELRELAFKAMVKETGWDNLLGFTADTFDYHFWLALQNDKLSFGGRQLWECYQKLLSGGI